ncbi:MAG TPA: hypothetical protein PKC68_02225 [Alphaproteobacteria bacterium]|nr:hypothetical protein [Alphaproteobacteria bacterium]
MLVRLLVILSTVTYAVWPASLLGQNSESGAWTWFSDVDWDKDQQLSYAEIDSECIQRFNRLDDNKDNQLSLAEVSSFLEYYNRPDKRQLQAIIQQRFTLIDNDKNQQISREECLQFNRQLVANCDSNYDGLLTRPEWQTCLTSAEQQR